MKFKQTNYGNNIEILKYGAQDYIARPIMVTSLSRPASSRCPRGPVC